jgi:hypothetical protein
MITWLVPNARRMVVTWLLTDFLRPTAAGASGICLNRLPSPGVWEDGTVEEARGKK